MHVKEYRELIKKNPAKKRSASGKREDLNNRFFRSKWEANYARYLNFLISQGEVERWEYENKEYEFPVKRGAGKFYKNDFEVFFKGTSELHEVKGYMDRVSQTKLNRMAKYYPEVTIKIIDAKWFKANSKILKGLIPYWE